MILVLDQNLPGDDPPFPELVEAANHLLSAQHPPPTEAENQAQKEIQCPVCGEYFSLYEGCCPSDD